MKYCPKCKRNRPFDLFSKNRTKKDGFAGQCKDCSKEQMATWYQRNKKKVSLKNKRYRETNKEAVIQYSREYYRSHKRTILEKQRVYIVEKQGKDIQFKLSRYLRSRLSIALRGNSKSGSAVKDLGCSITYLKQYLESLFESGMSWDNYGKWHIDHIKPLSSFDLTDRNQLLKACHYTNLQPLWAKENLIKGGRCAED